MIERLQGTFRGLSNARGAGRRASHRFVRFCFLAAVAFAAISSRCENPYETNPDLVRLLSIPGQALFKPTPSSDGKRIYFLKDSSFRSYDPSLAKFGSLHVLELQDSSERSILPGPFTALAVSPDGARLALVANQGPGDKHSWVLALDTSALATESLSVTSDGPVINVKFSPQSDEVVFNIMHYLTGGSGTSFFSWMPRQETTYHLVQEIGWFQDNFAVFDGDSIYADSLTTHNPALNPVDHRWVVYPGSIDQLGNNWLLYDRYSHVTAPLGSATKPYFSCRVDYPAWMSDGRDLVFSAGRPQRRESYEIWLLRDVPTDSLVRR